MEPLSLKHSFHNISARVLGFFPLHLFQKTSKLKSETETPIFNSFLERGNLDFVEQLWVRMRKSELGLPFRKLGWILAFYKQTEKNFVLQV